MKKTTSMIRKAVTASLTLGLLFFALTSSAEQVAVPIMSQSERSNIDVPRTGQAHSAVEARFGAPKDIKGPVGTPPITQWFYDDFVVYFEGDKVIHTVLKPKR
ncbi:hypothetical protein [Marinobacter caseinilyticus]|uniref:hypothetical protein n=1 Tax=Marinobacter caseinilyticus TaxID=2692195 RepID=UPI00140D924B|nr:hypothetical protein [Marinobacter caseinilyticus]